MRSMLPAAVVLGLAALVLSRSVLAGPPPPTKTRPMKEVLAELKKSPDQKPMLASARYASEVFKAQSAEQAPDGQIDVISPVMRALLARSCGALTKDELKASNALLETYGATLPPLVHAYALAQKGKTSEAGDLLLRLADVVAVPVGGVCPNEHPRLSWGRLEHLQLISQCVVATDPKRDSSKLQQQLKQARACAATNTVEG